MTYQTAEAIVSTDDAYVASIDLVRHYMAATKRPTYEQEVVCGLVLSALVLAYCEGYKHRDEMQ